MPTFDITRPKDILRLDGTRKGEIPFTVTNLTAQTIGAFLEVVPANPEDKAFFTVEGGTARNLRPNETQNVRVLIATPDTAAPGSHKFSLKVSDDAAPNDRFNESQSVEFTIPTAEKGGFKFPWWLIPVAALLLIGAVGLGWYLYTYPKIDDYRQRNAEQARLELERAGMKVKTVKSFIVLDSKQDDMVELQLLDGKPIVGTPRAKRGSEITLQVAGKMPQVVPMKLKDALLALADFPPGMIAPHTLKPATIASEEGTIAEQNPDPRHPEQPLPSDQKIHLTVYTKPDAPPPPVLVSVPLAITRRYCDAANMISDAGLVPVPVPTGGPNPFAPEVNGIVVAQSIPATPPGPQVPKQTPVQLIFQGIPGPCPARRDVIFLHLEQVQMLKR